MQSENVYIGDDKFQRFLDHYACPSKLWTVKFKFAGAICSPNVNLRPTDVISSLFPEDRQPRLETKAEAELFFKFFMGLWDEMFVQIRTNTLAFPEYKGNVHNSAEVAEFLHNRADMIELGFVEGFWGGCSTLNIPQFAAELISSLSDMAEAYEILAQKLDKTESPKDIYTVAQNTDKTVLKTIKFLIENLVLPHITNLERKVN